MKNYKSPEKDSLRLRWENEQLVPVPGFGGYYVDRFCRLISFSSYKGAVVRSHPNRCGKYTIWRFQLYDDEGNRRQISVNKLFKTTLGEDEYRKRERLGLNRDAVLIRENEAAEAFAEAGSREAQEQFDKEVAMMEELNGDMKKFTQWQRLGELF